MIVYVCIDSASLSLGDLLSLALGVIECHSILHEFNQHYFEPLELSIVNDEHVKPIYDAFITESSLAKHFLSTRLAHLKHGRMSREETAMVNKTNFGGRTEVMNDYHSYFPDTEWELEKLELRSTGLKGSVDEYGYFEFSKTVNRILTRDMR